MHHTFNSNEYKEFISVNCYKDKDYEEELLYLQDYFEDMQSWSRTLSGINHILCILLEQYEKRGKSGLEALEFIYNLPEWTNFHIQESQVRFLDILFENELSKVLSIEEQLIIAQNRLYGR